MSRESEGILDEVFNELVKTPNEGLNDLKLLDLAKRVGAPGAQLVRVPLKPHDLYYGAQVLDEDAIMKLLQGAARDNPIILSLRYKPVLEGGRLHAVVENFGKLPDGLGRSVVYFDPTDGKRVVKPFDECFELLELAGKEQELLFLK